MLIRKSFARFRIEGNTAFSYISPVCMACLISFFDLFIDWYFTAITYNKIHMLTSLLHNSI